MLQPPFKRTHSFFAVHPLASYVVADSKMKCNVFLIGRQELGRCFVYVLWPFKYVSHLPCRACNNTHYQSAHPKHFDSTTMKPCSFLSIKGKKGKKGKGKTRVLADEGVAIMNEECHLIIRINAGYLFTQSTFFYSITFTSLRRLMAWAS